MKKIFLFDVDNTLYPKECNLFKAVDKKINTFIKDVLKVPEDNVNNLRIEYFKKYGTTLNGLMKHYNVNPIYYLEYVHDVDINKYLQENKELKNILSKMDNKKIIFSNAYKPYILKILNRLGIENYFEDIIDIVKTNFIPKPLIEPYKNILKFYNKKPENFIMIDDSFKNLETGKNLGFITVLISNNEYNFIIFDYILKKIEYLEKIVDF